MSVPPLSDKLPSRARIIMDHRDHTKPIKCDCCGKSCRPKDISDEYCAKNEFDPQECVVLKGHWGYFSKKDLEYHECVLCEECYDKVAQFIVNLGGKIRRYEYDPWDGDPVQQMPSLGEKPTATPDCSES